MCRPVAPLVAPENAAIIRALTPISSRPVFRRRLALGVIALTLALAYGIWYSYGVILVALLAEFGWSRSVLAGAFSVFTLVHGGVNPLIGMLCARFQPLPVIAVGGAAMGVALFLDSFISSPLELYLAFGVATAIAVALGGWVPALVFVQREFPGAARALGRHHQLRGRRRDAARGAAHAAPDRCVRVAGGVSGAG